MENGASPKVPSTTRPHLIFQPDGGIRTREVFAHLLVCKTIIHISRPAMFSLIWNADKSDDIGKARLPVPPLLHEKGAGGTRTHTCLHTLELDR